MVGFHYELYDAQAQRIESSRELDPVLSLFGARYVLAGVQDALRGKRVGDEVTVDSVRPAAARSAILAAAAMAGLVASGPARALDIGELLGTLAGCGVLASSFDGAPAAPLYRSAQGGDGDGRTCIAALPDADGPERAWFLDAACTLPVELERSSPAAWCDRVLRPAALGEGVSGGEDDAVQSWSLSPGSRLDLGARSLEGVPQPWVSDTVYRRIETPSGTCELQMRVHAPRPVVEGRVADRPPSDGAGAAPVPAADGLAIIAWHGGSWSNRAFGSVGLELTVPHFTARGFTVYVPFYRLLGDSPDGSAACRDADFESDVVSDALAAFDWVAENGPRYGTSGAPVLFGQSAGGQLAARVAIERPEQVAGAVLFYAPVDFEDFTTRAQQGSYTDEQGLDILQRVLGVPVDRADVSATPVPENSLPRRIVRDGIDAPPVFMLHGEADALVEARQSVRLCDALAGRGLEGDAAEPGSIDPLRRVTLCGQRSSLHRIRQASHALDVCVLAGPIPLDSCPSGSEASRQRVADSIGSAVGFAETVAVLAALEAGGEPPEAPLQEGEQPVPPATDAQHGRERSGGGAPSPWALALLLAAALCRRSLVSLRQALSARTLSSSSERTITSVSSGQRSPWFTFRCTARQPAARAACRSKR